MANVFILNGAEIRGYTKGQYNQALCDVAKDYFSERGDAVSFTCIEDGYDIEEEVGKLEAADIIIYQFPIFWFHMPGKMKTYIDDVFMAGRDRIWLNDGRPQGGDYGSGGLMQKKKYMLSTTWNAPVEAFNDPDKLFDGGSVDDALFPFHKMKEFMGASALPSFSCHNIVRDSQFEEDKKRFLTHLESVFS